MKCRTVNHPGKSDFEIEFISKEIGLATLSKYLFLMSHRLNTHKKQNKKQSDKDASTMLFCSVLTFKGRKSA